MSIKDQIIADNTIFLDINAFAEQITYNGVQITADVFIGDSAISGDTFQKKGRSAIGTISISRIDVPNPSEGDAVVYDSTKWTVTRTLKSDFAMHKLQIISGESPWS